MEVELLDGEIRGIREFDPQPTGIHAGVIPLAGAQQQEEQRYKKDARCPFSTLKPGETWNPFFTLHYRKI
jgi:hypothetical protein